MSTPAGILKQYWGYDAFRPPQAAIIDAVLAGKDVLALLPTGGGKSICFQVPALMKEGICLVVTPLVALMRDQVTQLHSRGIKAIAIHAGMKHREIDIKLDNCAYGDIKFLYLSPERLKSPLFLARLDKFNVSFIAVDEAHCISQWGYDFRPSYLEIAEIRQYVPEANIIALTATATPRVQDDIKEKLLFKNEQQFQISFSRANLSYAVRKVEDKEHKLLETLQHVAGSAIVYVNNRKATKRYAELLHKTGIAAEFYHAGLSHDQRISKQDRWVQGRTRVMVATNAFGMGIDKADVRIVIHMSLPPDLESYYQEAGRAGRDGKKAYALIIYNEAELKDHAQRFEQHYPDPAYLKRVYQALANDNQLAIGSGMGESFDFDLITFSEKYKLDAYEVYHVLKRLEEEGLIQFNESFYNPSHALIPVSNEELYKFQIANAAYDPLIKTLLRSYGGELFSSAVNISEKHLAELMKTSEEIIKKQLEKLSEAGIILYEVKKDKPQVVYVTERKSAEALPLDIQRMKSRKTEALSKFKAVTTYVSDTTRCRTKLLLEYFGEAAYDKCGVCDVCVAERKKLDRGQHDRYMQQVVHVLEEQALPVEELIDQINPKDKDLLLEVVKELVDSARLKYDEQWRLKLV